MADLDQKKASSEIFTTMKVKLENLVMSWLWSFSYPSESRFLLTPSSEFNGCIRTEGKALGPTHGASGSRDPRTMLT